MSFCLFFFFTLQPNMVITLSTKNDSNKTNPNFQFSKRGFSDGSTSSLRDGSFFVNLKRTVYFCELSLKRNKRIGNKRVKLY